LGLDYGLPIFCGKKEKAPLEADRKFESADRVTGSVAAEVRGDAQPAFFVERVAVLAVEAE
jgi:hypothetical protein